MESCDAKKAFLLDFQFLKLYIYTSIFGIVCLYYNLYYVNNDI